MTCNFLQKVLQAFHFGELGRVKVLQMLPYIVLDDVACLDKVLIYLALFQPPLEPHLLYLLL